MVFEGTISAESAGALLRRLAFGDEMELYVVEAGGQPTEHSRPILEPSGFLRVSTTTPYHWRRP